MSKFLDKMLVTTSGIAPTGKERASGGPKTVTAMTINSTKLLERAEEAEALVKRLQEELATEKAQGGALEVALDMLVEVDGRRRKLTPDSYAELKDNLSKHELITPITVRVLPQGKYEIVSGHNRVAAYRELGRTTIKAWPADADESKTDELAFYANLLHPDLSAFEKYEGLKKIQENNQAIKTHAALAERTGLSRSLVTELLAFDDLPSDALAHLKKKPGALGTKAVSQLAALAKEGRTEQVIEAVRKSVEEGIEQQEAVRFASLKPKSVPVGEKRAPVTIKAGKKNYCSMVGAKKVLRLEFQSEEERAEVEAEIEELLKNRVQLKKLA